MKKLALFAFALMTALLVAACGGTTGTSASTSGEKAAAAETSTSAGTATRTDGKKILVAVERPADASLYLSGEL